MSQNTGKRLIAGCMSGTSADGVDVSVVEVEGRGLGMTAKPLSHAYEAFSPELRRLILDVRQRGEVKLADLAEIGRHVTLAHVPAFKAACAKANVSADQIAAIAAHGQTLWHGPPNTIQYFDPSLLAFETGCAIVSDFRRADLAAGGQGAPLVPFADWILFRHPTKSRVILNIGGIANLTYLKAGGSIDEVIAFDTGPGNCVSDALMRLCEPFGHGFDENGLRAMAAHDRTRSQRHDDDFDARTWAQQMICDEPFFSSPPPKSTDGPAMIECFLNVVNRDLARTVPNKAIGTDTPAGLVDELLYTATFFTVDSIHKALHDFINKMLPPGDVDLVVSGGGVHHALLMKYLAFENPLWHMSGHAGQMLISDSLGVSSTAREAIAFALLGAATLDGEPSNVPSATGASRRVLLGSITPKPF